MGEGVRRAGSRGVTYTSTRTKSDEVGRKGFGPDNDVVDEGAFVDGIETSGSKRAQCCICLLGGPFVHRS